jgi:hypothetical protein
VLSFDGADETTGDVEYEGHYSLMVFTVAVSMLLDEPVTVWIPAGAYIVSESSQGFVSVYTYDTEALAREDFKHADDAYGAWLEQEDDDV